MNDLISRSALLERLVFKRMGSMQRNTYPGLESAIAQVKKAPAVDAVEVVRCKDCKHRIVRYNGHRWCLAWDNVQTMGDGGFCCFGERKADNV